MSLDALMERMWGHNVLFSALLELTYSCNLHCAICYNDLNRTGEPLSLAQYRALFRDLRDLGALNLTLTGGEPLLHPNFFALGSSARELGFVVRIKTNGLALGERMARRLRDEVDPFNLDISLHGARAATHDRQTGMAGSFDRLMANLATLKALGLRFRLNCPVTRWNQGELEAMLALAEGMETHLNLHGDITPRDDGSREPLAVAPTRRGLERLERLQWRREEERRQQKAAQGESRASAGSPTEGRPQTPAKQCGAGSAGVAIDPFGNVYPCVQWRRPVGNLHRESIKDIWSHSGELRRIREQLITLKRLVDRYEGGRLMGFCAGRAQEETGDPLRVYPLAELRLQLRRRIRYPQFDTVLQRIE